MPFTKISDVQAAVCRPLLWAQCFKRELMLATLSCRGVKKYFSCLHLIDISTVLKQEKTVERDAPEMNWEMGQPQPAALSLPGSHAAMGASSGKPKRYDLGRGGYLFINSP